MSDSDDMFEDYRLAINNKEREFKALELENSEDEEDAIHEEW